VHEELVHVTVEILDARGPGVATGMEAERHLHRP
jgi:hypothetical protein